MLKEADLFCPNSVRINFTIYPIYERKSTERKKRVLYPSSKS
ncbi:ABC transporter ATP-binding protein [Lactiplantibacillus plantarum]|nr:ABC transporter ATP-binding protein [Lactiplantibacillus plantarum]